jgi:ABC-type transport system involved in multi-copper enzyme maturation permease subunit
VKVLLANVEEVFREAAARWTLVAYAALSTLFIGLFAAAVNLDVVDGALAGAKLFGREVHMGPKSIDLDRLVLGFESGFAGFLYVVATFLAVFATAHLVPRLQEKGTVDLYLSRPVGRVRLILSRYAGGLLLAGLNVAYLIGAMGLLIWWKTGVVHPRFLLAGAIIFFTIATLMAFAFLVGVVTSSTAVSIMATFAVFFLAAILSGHRQIEAALATEWAAALVRGFYWALPKTGQLAQATVDFVSGGQLSRHAREIDHLAVFGTTGLFGLASLSLSALLFRRKDF